jgi:serine protease Do
LIKLQRAKLPGGILRGSGLPKRPLTRLLNQEHREMKRTVFLASCAGVLVGAFLTAKLLQNRNANAPPPDIRADDTRTAVGVKTTFAPVVKKVAPAVVNISSTRIIKTAAPGDETDSMDEFFRRFFGGGGGRVPFGSPQRPTERRASSLGSGVIVSANGYVLTNNHVVEQATSVKVALSDRRELPAKIIGNDPQTDIALLKIDAKDLPNLHMGDSSKVEVGDIALALGNPFGIGQTVTMGIIGAKSRGGLGIEDYEDFIQTDAAINPGNSGGALVNTNGDLIAINTAILSGGGGNQGIGFAIPINMAKEVMDQLTKSGKITRGFIGAGIQDVTPALAKAFKLPDTRGAMIREVEPNSPAAKAGLQPGDVVTAVDNDPVNDSNSFKLRISRVPPGTTVHLKVIRDGAVKDIPITPTKRPDQVDKNEEGNAPSLKGVSVDDLTPDIARQLRLPPNTKGVVVVDVDPGSPASDSGLHSGDVIQQVNRKPVTNVQQFMQAISQAGKDTTVLLVNRGGQTQFVAVEPG